MHFVASFKHLKVDFCNTEISNLVQLTTFTRFTRAGNKLTRVIFYLQTLSGNSLKLFPLKATFYIY